jgi:hypothetical protein
MSLGVGVDFRASESAFGNKPLRVMPLDERRHLEILPSGCRRAALREDSTVGHWIRKPASILTHGNYASGVSVFERS